MKNRKILTTLFGVGFTVWGLIATAGVKSDWQANEDLTAGAPQQQVAASWAVKDAAILGLQMLGVLGGLVIISLTALADRGSEEEEAARIESGAWRRCPACMDIVPSAASMCRSCGEALPAVAAPPDPAPVI